MEFVTETNRIVSFEKDGNRLAEINFPSRDESRVDITHVFVNETLRGQGIASKLMEMAYQEIKSRGLRIVAKCPYAISWFKKHPEFQDIVINVKTKINQ